MALFCGSFGCARFGTPRSGRPGIASWRRTAIWGFAVPPLILRPENQGPTQQPPQRTTLKSPWGTPHSALTNANNATIMRRTQMQLRPNGAHLNVERQKMSIADVLTAQYFTSGRRACWAPHLRAEFNCGYMRQLRRFLIAEEAEHIIFPQPARIFEALDKTTLDEVQVVIIGQDPYPTRGQAHGLAFSVECGERPQSLSKIIAEVNRDMDEYLPPGCNRRRVAEGCGCLTPWAKQGVLLLNPVLTVREGCPNSHRNKGWERFTDRIIETINAHCEHVVFMLWGRAAQQKGSGIDRVRHRVLCARHPRIGIKGSRHFSKANQYFEDHHIKPIDWLDVCCRPLPE